MKKEQQKSITPKELRAALVEQPYDLSGRLLVGIKLERLDLEGLNLRGATLRGCTFAHCKFDNSCFEGADLGDTKFIRCKMEYCFFDGAKQEDAVFELCARFGSTGINGDTRSHSEVVFDDVIGILRGMNMALAPDWRQFAWEICESDEENYGTMLCKLQEKFHEIDEAYPGMGAEIFNSGLRFMPHELRGAANFIAQGNTVEAAHRQAVDSAFSGADTLPEHEMFVLPHSEVQKNILAERAFTERMQQIEGLNYFFSRSWFDLARGFSTADEGVTVGEDYRQLLQEYGDAFEEIGQRDNTIAAVLFSSESPYLPHELLPAAEMMINGLSMSDLLYEGYIDEPEQEFGGMTMTM